MFASPSKNDETATHPKTWTKFKGEASEEGSSREINHCGHDLDDAHSETSDPVFKWLEDTI